jgi:hypothetical protein
MFSYQLSCISFLINPLGPSSYKYTLNDLAILYFNSPIGSYINIKNNISGSCYCSALALVIAPSLMATVSAAPNTVCVKKTGNGGTVSPPGQDQPNTPPGKANCPPPFKAKNENAVK